MPQNVTCLKCHKPMHFVVETDGRKFRCADCDMADPVAAQLTLIGEFGRKANSPSSLLYWIRGNQ
jgi:hypothetical protein